ncbi:4-hydroxy-tetrahydrodipicolinate synthase [Alkalibacter saccharofermentans]|uniref:4-hydroxy-tetrahydrodipicolinate synthase n=1 Tax=Alkalibacter saccharofermentans DSM 14828 TaxID=1120975 RepID=A0A1M4WG48_9FIRM|nr:4-hydroxy-tetrahydrodipicolinate synthase [Alkalibacter saccharofermentans]SHE80229.1 4-hydroxy-tetrahydrodipicolinate synthase [Alkalibacter saccharofermentans DSM 14828]
MKIEELIGVIPPIITPVDDNENVDVEGLKRVIDHVVDGGVHGVFVLGSNGEFYALDNENQKLAVETTVKHVNGKVPVYAGTGEITTKACVKAVQMAEDAGADAMSVLTPMFINPSEKEMYAHFETIAKATSLPILLYNNPGKTTNNISVSMLKRLAEIDNIIGIKNTSLDFSQTVEYIDATRDNDTFEVLSGTDYYIYATLMYGGVGCVAGTANVAPRLVSDIYDKFVVGDYKGAMKSQFDLVPLRKAYNFGSFPVVMKDCLNLMGLNVGHPVKPIGHCSEEKMEDLKKVLADLDLI